MGVPLWLVIESLNFTASITSQSGTPTGSVLFYDGATQIGSGPLTNGSAILTINSLTPGTHSITAAYDGSNTAFAKSTSPAIVQTIKKVTPIFTVLTASQTIDPSIVPSVSLGGTIMATSGSITGNVNITLNG